VVATGRAALGITSAVRPLPRLSKNTDWRRRRHAVASDRGPVSWKHRGPVSRRWTLRPLRS